MKKVLISTIMASFLIFSCEKVEEISENENVSVKDSEILVPTSAKISDSKSLRISYSEGSESYENFAKELAMMLSDKEMRKFFKNEASKQFDGDFDILVSNHPDKFKTSENLVKETPKLNIGFNELIQKWDTDKNSILVASRVGLNPEAKALVAYDAKGRRYEIDSKIEPDRPIMVVGYNERIDFINGKIEIMKFAKENENTSLSKSRPMACTYPNRSGAASYERLKGMKFTDLSFYEQWYDFQPEIKFRVFAPSQSNSYASVGKIIEQNYSPSRSSVNGSWWNFNTPLFIWLTPQYPTTMLYEFMEIDDYGQSSTVTVGLSQTFGIGSNNSSGTPNITGSITPTIGFSYTKKGADVLIGLHPVEMLFCPPFSDGASVFGAGSTEFFYKAGY